MSLQSNAVSNRDSFAVDSIKLDQDIDFMDGGVVETDLGRIESHSVLSRCAVRLVHEVISGFNENKRNLVKEIGFEGLLQFPALKYLNSRFSVWLMSKVDELSQAVVIDEKRSIPFTNVDVGLIFGIPFTGRRVVDRRLSRKPVKLNVIPNFAGSDSKEQRSIKFVQELLVRDYACLMTKEEEDTFKVAFVVFVMSCLLAPCTKHDYTTADYWNALSDPSEIQNFDWSSYVVSRLLEAVVKLKTDLMRKTRVFNLTGCALFLQILYLDSMDLGIWNMSHSYLPRVRSFTADRIRLMIDADSNLLGSGPLNIEYGQSKLRPVSEVCYSWASESGSVRRAATKDEQSTLWDDTVLMARQLRIPTQVAGPVFMAIVEHRKQINEITFQQSRKLVKAVANIIRPFMDGFSYNLDYDSTFSMLAEAMCGRKDSLEPLLQSCIDEHCVLCGADHSGMISSSVNKVTSESCQSEPCSSSIVSEGSCSGSGSTSREGSFRQGLNTIEEQGFNAGSLFRCGHILNLLTDATMGGPSVEVMVTTAMSRVFMMSRLFKNPRRIDLNKESCRDDFDRVPLSVRYDELHIDVKSPWEMGFDGCFDKGKAVSKLRLLEEMTDMSNMRTSWFVHYTPKFIEVIGIEAWQQLTGHSELEMDMFDALIRRFKQVDDSLYAAVHGVRWRHFIESEFMLLLLAGWPKCFEKSVREQLLGLHLGYEVPRCKMIFFPVLLGHRWVCYAWRMNDNVVVVFDPLSSAVSGEAIDSFHVEVVNLLKSGMYLAASKFFVGWDHDFRGASLEYYRPFMFPIPRNRTGVVVAYFCRSFDGCRMVPDIQEVTVDDISGLMLCEAASLAGNCGDFPADLFV